MLLGLVATILLAASPAATPQHPNASIPASDAKVLGISLQDSEATVRRLLGVPSSVERSHDEMADAEASTLRYEGIVVYVVQDEVYRLSCGAPRCVTGLGVRIGDRMTRVFEIYGTAEVQAIHGAQVVRYNIKGTDCWLDFRLQDGRVAEIQMWFDYS